MAGGNGIAGGLRAPMTSFVGRRQELLDVRVLTSCHRIVTLIGPGGVGKTRLALEAVRAEASDQVIAVDLAAVDGDVANAVLGALDGPVRSNEEPLESVVRFLRSRSLCLVLDNCEHVVEEASAFVERLVQRCPRTTLLATSRVPLRAADEQLYLVPAMSMKGERSEALALYRARADRHAPQRPPTTSLWSPHCAIGSMPFPWASNLRRHWPGRCPCASCWRAWRRARSFSRAGLGRHLPGKDRSTRRCGGAFACSSQRNGMRSGCCRSSAALSIWRLRRLSWRRSREGDGQLRS